MQKLFIVKEIPEPKDTFGNYSRVNEFIGRTGKIVSVTPFGVAASGTSSNQLPSRVAGRLLVVADDGLGENIGL